MPFTSFKVSSDAAFAQAAFKRAWEIVKSEVRPGAEARERGRLAQVVADYAVGAAGEDDLTHLAVAKFRLGREAAL